MISIKFDGLDRVQRQFAAYPKQIPFAVSRALNAVAFQAMREGQQHIRQKIDRPTQFTVKSWYVRRKAKKTDLTAVVGWSDYLSSKRIQEGVFAGAEFYLSQHWNGGPRKYKAFERQLRNKGFLPNGMFAVPGKAADDLGMIDRFGNMKGSVIVAIMSSIGALDELGYTSNATVRQSKKMGAAKSAAKKVYWAGKPGKNTPLGIWMIDEKFSKRGRLRPVMIFVRTPRYRKVLDIDAVAKTVQQRDLRREFEKAMDYALATAR